jgi:uncharacterized pyridoxal phosphate-containing UPF0001 family protein
MDSERLAVALHDVAVQAGATLNVLVQVNVSGETTKSGMEPARLAGFADQLLTMPHLRV